MRSSGVIRGWFVAAVVAGTLSGTTVFAAGLGLPGIGLAALAPAGMPVDVHSLDDLEARALQAGPREQAAMYADLADRMTLLVSQQISAGETEAAEQTLLRLESCTDKLKGGLLANSKGLKKAELMLHTTQRRLQDLARVSSSDLRPRVQSAMKRLDSVQTALLGMIFEK